MIGQTGKRHRPFGQCMCICVSWASQTKLLPSKRNKKISRITPAKLMYVISTCLCKAIKYQINKTSTFVSILKGVCWLMKTLWCWSCTPVNSPVRLTINICAGIELCLELTSFVRNILKLSRKSCCLSMLSLTFQLSAVLPRIIREEASGATSHQNNKAHSLLDWHFLMLEKWLTRVKIYVARSWGIKLWLL